MAEYVRYQTDITGFPVEGRSVGRAELVRRNMLRGYGNLSILFHKIFYGIHTHPFSLQGVEEGLFLAFHGVNELPFRIDIVGNCIVDIVSEIEDILPPAFPDNRDGIHGQIHIV